MSLKKWFSASHKVAQNRALSQLEDIGNNGGLRLSDKAALQDQQIENSAKARGDRQAIEANAAQRGVGGSGVHLASQLAGQQADADRDSRSRLSIAAAAKDRALQAIMGAGNLCTGYRNQDFNQQAQKATAADRINMFNAQNLQSVQNRNVERGNQAQAGNLCRARRNYLG